MKMINEILTLLSKQESDISEMDLTHDEIDSYVFGDGDVVQHYLAENNMSEDSVDLEWLRDLQHEMVSNLKS